MTEGLLLLGFLVVRSLGNDNCLGAKLALLLLADRRAARLNYTLVLLK